MSLTISVEKLINWNDSTAQKFHDFIQANPAVFSLPSDVRGETIAGTLQHIVSLELRFAQLIGGLAESPLEDVSRDSINIFHATHRRATQILTQFLADPTFDWAKEVSFEIPARGVLSASRETFLVHLTMHSIRHYAQLATIIRQAGLKPNWSLDYLFTEANPIPSPTH